MRASAPEVCTSTSFSYTLFAAARRASLGSGGFIKASTNVADALAQLNPRVLLKNTVAARCILEIAKSVA